MQKPHPLSRQTLLATAAAATLASVCLAFSHPDAVVIDGQRIASDVPPVTTMQAGERHAYVPLRAVTESLGAATQYDRASRTIEVTRGADTLRLRVGDRNATLNGRPMVLNHAPFTVRGRAMVATTTIQRALGPKVRYNPRKSTIDVFTNDAAVAADGADDSSATQ